MGFKDAIRTCLRKYVTFSGRATRPEYWWFILFTFLGSLVAGVVDNVLFGTGGFETSQTSFEASAEGPITTLFSLFVLLPSLSAGWRRMHDTGRSGLYLIYPIIVMVGLASAVGFFGGMEALVAGSLGGFAALVLGLGVIVLIISPLLVLWWLTRPTQAQDNEYGPNPYASAAPAAPWGAR